MLHRLLLFFLPALLAGQVLVVNVQDAIGETIKNARARLLSLDRVIEAQGGPDGHIQLNPIPSGTYDLQVSSPGFETRTHLGLRITPAGPKSFNVVLAPHTGCNNPEEPSYQPLQPGTPKLTGKVSNHDPPTALAGAKVRLTNPDSPDQVFEATTDAAGNFQIPDITAGRYHLRLTKNNYQPTELKRLLIPKENRVTLNLALVKKGPLIVCQ